jgi:hypothetical protein
VSLRIIQGQEHNDRKIYETTERLSHTDIDADCCPQGFEVVSGLAVDMRVRRETWVTSGVVLDAGDRGGRMAEVLDCASPAFYQFPSHVLVYFGTCAHFSATGSRGA